MLSFYPLFFADMIFDGVPLSDHTGNIKANVQEGFFETLHEHN